MELTTTVLKDSAYRYFLIVQDQQRHFPKLILFIAAIGLFVFAIPAREFIGFETRFALFAQEMLRNGWTLFPHTYLGPYPDYPGPSTWVVAFLAKLFGGLSLPIAVIPSAILSAWTLVLTWRIGALEDKRWAWAAVLALLGTQAFFQQARTLSIDPYVMALLTTSMWLILRADHESRPLPVYKLLLLQFAALAIRGPIGLVMLAGVNTVYFFALGQWRRGLNIGLRALGALITGTGLLLLAAWIECGSSFMNEVLRMQVLGRFRETTDPLGTYWVNSFGNYFYTYMLTVPVVLIYWFMRPALTPSRQRLFLALIVWVLVILVGMSIPATKKARYILPIAPALALLASSLVLSMVGEKYWQRLQKASGYFLRALPLLVLIGLGFLSKELPKHDMDLSLNLWTLGSILLLLGWIGWRNRTHFREESTKIYLIATATLICTNLILIEPFNWKKQTSAEFVNQVEKLRKDANAELGFFNIGKDGAAVVYMVNADTSDRPRFYTQKPNLDKLQKPLYLIMKKHNAKQLFSEYPPAYQGVMDGKSMTAIPLQPKTALSK